MYLDPSLAVNNKQIKLIFVLDSATFAAFLE